MSTVERLPAITPEMMAQLDQAAKDAMNGVRDPQAMRRAAEEMDSIREAIFRRIGLVDFAVPTIRALSEGE